MQKCLNTYTLDGIFFTLGSTMAFSAKYFRVIFLCGLLLQETLVSLRATASTLEQQQVVEFMTENAREVSMLNALL